MGKFIDLTGQKFGRLTAKERGPNIGKTTTWICECNCDEHNIVTVRYSALVTGATRSCGCLAREQSALNGKKCAKTNPVNLDGEYGIGWTLNTNREFYFDLEDYDKIKNFCWYERVDKTGYHILRTNMWVNGKRQTVTMHQWLGFANHDHHNRNSFDNRKENLWPATSSENNCNQNIQVNNTSGFVGVIWNEQANLWRAFLMKDNEIKLSKYYKRKEDAIVARLKAEKEFMGDFAPQRHLFEEYSI